MKERITPCRGLGREKNASQNSDQALNRFFILTQPTTFVNLFTAALT